MKVKYVVDVDSKSKFFLFLLKIEINWFTISNHNHPQHIYYNIILHQPFKIINDVHKIGQESGTKNVVFLQDKKTKLAIFYFWYVGRKLFS